MKYQTLFSGTNQKKKEYFKISVDLFFFDWATGMCNHYFCKHLMKYCRGESYYHTSYIVFPINSQSAANQMIGTRTLHVAHLYWGADGPVSGIINLWLYMSCICRLWQLLLSAVCTESAAGLDSYAVRMSISLTDCERYRACAQRSSQQTGKEGSG